MLYEINEKALKLESEGKKIIRLNLGDPDLATPPEIVEAAYASMKAGKTKYSSSYGELKLRQKIAEVHGVQAENVVITCLLYTSPSPRDRQKSRMPSSA